MKSISSSLKKYLDKNLNNKSINGFFVDEFKKNPNKILPIILNELRTSQSDLKYILDSFADKDSGMKWYYSENGYLRKYTDYVYGLFNDAKSPEEMVKYLPIIAPWTYARSFETTDMGTVPTSFANKEILNKLIEKIIDSKALKVLKSIKDYDHDVKKLHKDYPEYKNSNFNCFFEKGRILREIISKKIEKNMSIKVSGYEFIVEPMCNPFTNKVVFKVTALSDNKLFILKISPNNIKEIKSDYEAKSKENQMLRGDSPYLNAIVDFYLKFNKCENASNIVYYNYDYDFVLYEADDGVSPEFNDEERFNLYEFNNKHLSDCNKLGIFMNDVDNGNFLQSKTGKLTVIDSGHVSYSNAANPGVVGNTINLSNLCGRSLISTFGSYFIND